MDLDMVTLKKERFVWIDQIVNHVLESALGKRDRAVRDLIEKNQAHTNYHTMSVKIGTALYAPSNYTKSPATIYTPVLHLSLLEEGLAFQEMDDELKFDRKHLTQNLGVLVNKCLTHQDIRDALPDILQNATPWMQTLPRTREEAWPFKDDPMKMEQYQQTLKKIYYHFTKRML